MTVATKNLRETLAEAAQETAALAAAQPQETTEVSGDRTEETNAGEPSEPEFVSGIDISDIPAQDRPRIKELLSKKANLLERGYQPKFQKVAALDKALTELTSKGLSVEEAQTVLDAHVRNKQNPQALTVQEKKNVKKLDELLNMSQSDQREALHQLRQITQEEASDSPMVKQLAERLEKAERRLQYFEGKDVQLGITQAESDLNSLSDKFGKTFIEKHRDIVLGEKQKYPQAKVKDILKYVVPDEEYEQALFDNRKEKTGKPITKEKLNAISSSGGGVTSSQEIIDTKNTSYKDIFRNLTRK